MKLSFIAFHKIYYNSDVKDYHECKLSSTGNVFQWDTAKLEMEDLQTADLDPQTFCAETPYYYISKGEGKSGKLTFSDGLEFCSNIGGEMAVISEESTVDSLPLSVSFSTWLGFTDKEKVCVKTSETAIILSQELLGSYSKL